MRTTARGRTEAIQHLICILLICALSLSIPLVPRASTAYAEELDIAPPVYEQRNDYLRDNLDGDAKDALAANENLLDPLISALGFQREKFRDTGHTLYLKLTLVDRALKGTDTTFESLFFDSGWMEAIAGQFDLTADLLDPGEASSYLIAYASPSTIKGITTITDVAFTTLDNSGNVVDGPYMDKDRGIIYVPKELYERDGEEIAFALQAQMLALSDVRGKSTCDVDISIECHDPRVQTEQPHSIRASTFDISLSIPLTQPKYSHFISLNDLSVRINGSDSKIDLIEGNNAAYDARTGCLELFYAPLTLTSVDISIDAPHLLEYFTTPAAGDMPSQALSFVPEVVFDKLDLSALKIGQTFDIYTDFNYWWPNVSEGDFGWQACIASGAYCYSWVNDPDSLYEYIAWNNNATWNGVAEGAVSNFTVTPNGSQASRNYFNYVFWFGEHVSNGQYWHSERWPINCNWDSGYGNAHFGLQCCHTTNALPTGPDPTEGTMKLRVLDLNTADPTPYIVLGFVGPAVANQPGVGVYKFAIKAKGKIDLTKQSGNPALSEGNHLYTMEGIAYDIFTNPACTEYLSTITLDANGHGTSPDLQPGTYYLKENVGSVIGRGFAVDERIHRVDVTAGNTSALSVTDTPQSARIDLLLNKLDAQSATSAPQGNALLSGAEFKIEHYDAYLDGGAEALGNHTPTRTWHFKTDDAGAILLDDDHLIGGDELYLDSTGAPCMPLGTVSIQETKPPCGYLLDPTVILKKIEPEGTAESIHSFAAPQVSNHAIRGGVRIDKLDAESLLPHPLGAATLDGTTFEIVNRSAHPVCVGGIFYPTDAVVATICVQDGCAMSTDDLLPYGSYLLREVAAGDGYLLTDTAERVFDITENGKIVPFTQQNAAQNRVKRGDFSFIKVRETNQERMEGIPFLITSKTTGEQHVVLSGEMGKFDTSAAWHPHTASTNANDRALKADGTVDEELLDEHAGVWFGKAENGITQPNDTVGALPFDTYHIEELPCTKNHDLELITLDDIKVNRDAYNIFAGTVIDRLKPTPSLHTSAKNAQDASKYLSASSTASLLDRVEYSGLTQGKTYVLTGTLYRFGDGQPLTDIPGATVSKTFSCEQASGYVDMAFTLDTRSLAGQKIVVFERLIDETTGEVVATHEDLSDPDQTLFVNAPLIETYAASAITNDKEIVASPETHLIDTISYCNLEPGREYTVSGSLALKNPHDETTTSLLDETGTPITASQTFTAKNASGITSVAFDFDSTQLEPESQIVVFETLLSDGQIHLEHSDPNNAAQTVRIAAPTLKTHAHIAESADHIAPQQPTSTIKKVDIVDTVEYANVQAGRTYTMQGTLMTLAPTEGSKTAQATPYLDEEGNPLTTTVSFTPESANGTLDIPFAVTGDDLSDEHFVVFEKLFLGDEEIAAHEDAESAEQSVFTRPTPNDDASRTPKTLSSLPQTGDSYLLGAILALSTALALACSLFFSRMARKTQRSCARKPVRTSGRMRP